MIIFLIRILHLVNLFLIVPFFFSSRRRHTRLVSDWSSDVCSSDLVQCRLDVERTVYAPEVERDRRQDAPVQARIRSEERRVGKECRYSSRANNTKRKLTSIKRRTSSNKKI